MIVPGHNSRCREKRTEYRMLSSSTTTISVVLWIDEGAQHWKSETENALIRCRGFPNQLLPTHLHQCIHPFLLFTFISIQAHPHFPRRKRHPAPASGYKSCWAHIWPTILPASLPACLCEKNIQHQAKQPSPHRPGHRFSVTQSWLITWLGGSSAQASESDCGWEDESVHFHGCQFLCFTSLSPNEKGVDKLSFRGLKYNYNIGDVFSSTEISCNKICNFGVDDDYYHNKVLIRVPLMLLRQFLFI